MSKMPSAISESTFTLLGVTLRCCVLDNGERIINAEDVEQLFEAMASPGTINGTSKDVTEEMEKFAKWRLGK